MTLEKLALYLSEYILEHWQTILLQIFGILSVITTATWFIAKSWYTREIQIQKQENNLNKKSFEQEIKHLTNQAELTQKALTYQLDQSKNYASGVIEILNQRVSIAEQEPKRLENIINDQSKQLLIIQEQKNYYKNIMRKNLKEPKDKYKKAGNKDLKDLKEYIIFLLDNNNDDPDSQGNYFKYNFSTETSYYTENSTNFSELLQSISYILYFQNETNLQTKIKLNQILNEKNSLYNNYLQSCKTIIEPLSNLNSEKVFKTFSLDSVDDLLLEKIEKKYYLNIYKNLLEDKTKKEGKR